MRELLVELREPGASGGAFEPVIRLWDERHWLWEEPVLAIARGGRHARGRLLRFPYRAAVPLAELLELAVGTADNVVGEIRYRFGQRRSSYTGEIAVGGADPIRLYGTTRRTRVLRLHSFIDVPSAVASELSATLRRLGESGPIPPGEIRS